MLPMFRAFCRLLCWWCRSFLRSASTGLGEWRNESEWPLLAVGGVFCIGFLSHWLGYLLAKYQLVAGLFGPAEWEGRTGWRKPLVFCLSNTLIFGALRHLLRAQTLAPRRLCAHVAAWATAVEVGIITLQAWRDTPSHFNTSTRTDTLLYVVKLAGAALLSFSCISATIGCIAKPLKTVPPVHLLALRHGGSLITMSIAFAVWQVVHGHSMRLHKAEEDELCLRVTAGVHRSPCYEIRGGNILKLTHFLPLHATEPLLLMSWAISQARTVGGTQIIKTAAACHWSLAIVGLVQSIRGRSAVLALVFLGGMFQKPNCADIWSEN